VTSSALHLSDQLKTSMFYFGWKKCSRVIVVSIMIELFTAVFFLFVESSTKVSFFHQCSKMQIIPIKTFNIQTCFFQFLWFFRLKCWFQGQIIPKIHLILPNAYTQMCFDRNINGNRDVKFLIGIIGHCTDERNLLYCVGSLWLINIWYAEKLICNGMILAQKVLNFIACRRWI